MTLSVRFVLSVIGVAFTAYLAARAFFWGSATVERPLIVVAALVLYVLTTLVCIFWNAQTSPALLADEHAPVEPPRHYLLPIWAAVLAVATALIVPNAVAFAVGADFRAAPFATWYIGGLGLLMTIVMVRHRPWTAWMGMAALTAFSMFWLGPLEALGLGLVGSILWVAAAQLTQLSLDKAARDTGKLAQLQRAASGWQASQTGRERERRIQVQRALAIAGPILARTIMTNGVLDEFERREARLAEGQLRDELRAPRLLDDAVRTALTAARRRGATVTVLDEGGLEGVEEGRLAVIRAELARTISEAGSDRLYIRTSPDEQVAVTVVGRTRVGASVSEDDDVDLFAEIPHHAPHDTAPNAPLNTLHDTAAPARTD